MSNSTESNAAVPESRHGLTPGGQEAEVSSYDPLHAAHGFKNALIYGGVLWMAGYLLFSLVDYVA